MQNKITEPSKLLDANGNLKQKGYATELILDYARTDIKAGKSRIKEWDYYLIYNDKHAVAFTVDDNSYMGLLSAAVIDFTIPKEKTTSQMKFFTGGKTGLPGSSKNGDINVKTKKADIKILNDGSKREIFFTMQKFDTGETLDAHFILTDEPKENMTIATPFEKPKHFYYNQKIVGIKAEGTVRVGNTEISFSKNDTRAILDWGRGVWTYKNTWYWGAGCGAVSGHEFGFNIGYGFGDISAATENMLFYNGKAHKLEYVVFNIPKTAKGKDDYMAPWTFSESSGRFQMEFTPIIDRAANMDFWVLASKQHQVFGKFNGKAVLDDGKEIVLKDFLGFAEKVHNKW